MICINFVLFLDDIYFCRLFSESFGLFNIWRNLESIVDNNVILVFCVWGRVWMNWCVMFDYVLWCVLLVWGDGVCRCNFIKDMMVDMVKSRVVFVYKSLLKIKLEILLLLSVDVVSMFGLFRYVFSVFSVELKVVEFVVVFILLMNVIWLYF